MIPINKLLRVLISIKNQYFLIDFSKKKSISGDQSFHSKINIRLPNKTEKINKQNQFKNQKTRHVIFQICHRCQLQDLPLCSSIIFQEKRLSPMYTCICTLGLSQGTPGSYTLYKVLEAVVPFFKEPCPFSRINVLTCFLHPFSGQQEMQ